MENTFKLVQEGGNSHPDIPAEISGETAKRALALVDYFNSHKEILLQAHHDAERSGSEEGVKSIKERIMSHPGIYVTPRNCVKSITPVNRPKTEAMVDTMKGLETDGMGKVIKVGRFLAFAKEFPLEDSKLRETCPGLSPQMYRDSLVKKDKHLSAHQLETFQKAYLQTRE